MRISCNSLKNHKSVKHRVDECMRGQTNIDGMESFWSMVGRGYDGAFHHLEWHLHRYTNEFAGLHNIREYDTVDMIRQMAENMVGQRLLHGDLISHI